MCYSNEIHIFSIERFKKRKKEKVKLTIQCTGFIIIDSDIVEMASVILEIKQKN